METEKVFNRTKELIKRDPLFHELSETFHKIINSRGSRTTGEGCILQGVERDICSHLKTGEDFFAKYQEIYPGHWKLRNLAGDISAKWYVFLKFDPVDGILILPGTYDEVIYVGNPSLDHYPELEWTPHPDHLHKEPILADMHYFLNQTYNGKRERWIPIVINIDRINNDNTKKVRTLIWKIIKSNLQKGGTRKPPGEYQECAFLYSIRREETFQNYLRWYDLHTKEKLGFRLIALIDSRKVKRLSENKISWGKPAEGEDKVEKGIKCIFEAIHRVKYTKEKIGPIVEEYNCPEHSRNCPTSCKYYEDWNSRFNCLMPSF